MLTAMRLVLNALFHRVKSYTELGCRTKPNLNDLRLTLEELNIGPDNLQQLMQVSGAEGWSNRYICGQRVLISVIGSGQQEVLWKKRRTESQSVLEFETKEFQSTDAPTPRPPQVYSYLPPYPSEHTYKATNVSGLRCEMSQTSD
jgi:hypothetical protein